MRKYMNSGRLQLALLAFTILIFAACGKDTYYQDGGKENAKFDGTILQYLESNPRYFDTLVTVIKLAGMEKEFNNDQFTFFAPVDNSFRGLIKTLNTVLYATGKDTVVNLNDIPDAIWQKYVSVYMFKGLKKVNDYPQIDLNARGLYPGQNYKSLGDVVFNIGAIYDNAGNVSGTGSENSQGVKYAGYRHLCISFIPNTADPLANWNTVLVSSSDIQPNNGVVHVLKASHTFSFDATNFIQDVLLSR
ncbi:fasciclin domain-containing protein [Pedobacter hiemivivus]|uniref:FAS1 domain-containing protein n=1 Tax=Pedobacter hiemivivus TaxID=2530454 RepID=A0A4R0NG52_9SPHI|nr:fasciclin domain-containing protein [Pedobacter hiemivivus]TCC99491.1 hypothetical protein EZ444_02110 [Pedobacter hiemivivus]